MTSHRIAAEVEVQSRRARQAATALHGLGFRVLRVGARAISVDAPSEVWESTGARSDVSDGFLIL